MEKIKEIDYRTAQLYDELRIAECGFLKIEDENFTIVKSLPNAKARLVYWENNSWIEEEYSQDKIKIKIRNN